MSRVLVKENLISNVVITSVNSSINHITNASNNIATWAIPYGFSQRYNLINCINEVSSIKTDLKKVETFLTKSVKDYTNAEDDMNNVAKLLPTNRIKLREPINR
jgi:hypothetical protein